MRLFQKSVEKAGKKMTFAVGRLKSNTSTKMMNTKALNNRQGPSADIKASRSYPQFGVTISTTYNCSLERAFKTPLLCDVSKIHTGYGLMPKVTHCTEDENWGQVGSSKKVYAAKSLTQKGGFVSVDTILERIENQYWKFQVDDFQSWMLGFYKFVGEWRTTAIEPNKILIEYTYTLHSNIALLYPLNWLFAKTFWKIYMKRVLENVRHLADNQEPYKYENF